MKAGRCNGCGSSEFVKEGGLMRCAYCGTTYAFEAKSSSIAIDDDIRALLRKCEMDPSNARRYANLVLDIDPDNVEALKYL